MSGTRGKHQAGGSGWHTGGDPFQEETKTKRRKKKRKKLGGKKAALIAAGTVAALALVVAGVWAAFVRAPDVSQNDRPGVQTGGGETEESEGPETAAGRKEDYYTFLLIGRDTGGGGNTDTLILVSYDVANDQVNMMSIPRDTAVNVSWSTKKINSVYNASEENGGGIEGLKTQVGYLTGIVPDFYVIIEWEAVGELVDAVGGVEFDVPRDMNYDDPYQDLHIHLEEGLQVLNGEQAMGVIRYRHDNTRSDGVTPGYANGDLGRTETQQAFLKAMAKEVLQLGNMTKIGEFVRIFMDHVETDLQLGELMWFASQALGMDADTIQSCTMPNESRTHRGGSYVFADIEEMLPLLNEQFNPYLRDITEEDLQVIVRNSDGSCYVTNGTLLDSRWANPTSSGSSSSGGSSSGSASGSTETQEPAEEEPAEEEPVLPEDGGTGDGTTDPGTGDGETTDPGTGDGTTDPGEGDGSATDPGDGGTDTDPDAGGGTPTDPGTGDGTVTDPGTDPGAGGAAADQGAGTEPQLPPEPALPDQGIGGTDPAAPQSGGEAAAGETGGE